MKIPLTYRQLKRMLGKLSDKQLDNPVVVVDLDDEDVFTITEFVGDWDNHPWWLPHDLDKQNPYLPFTRKVN